MKNIKITMALIINILILIFNYSWSKDKEIERLEFEINNKKSVYIEFAKLNLLNYISKHYNLSEKYLNIDSLFNNFNYKIEPFFCLSPEAVNYNYGDNLLKFITLDTIHFAGTIIILLDSKIVFDIFFKFTVNQIKEYSIESIYIRDDSYSNINIGDIFYDGKNFYIESIHLMRIDSNTVYFVRNDKDCNHYFEPFDLFMCNNFKLKDIDWIKYCARTSSLNNYFSRLFWNCYYFFKIPNDPFNIDKKCEPIEVN
ncbi:MAG: hypothetical protein NT007_06780 [Candidatus Kapabacteria bacterium]|nr:hypothetical protein [Candidatus Kapabacteria bacterium]